MLVKAFQEDYQLKFRNHQVEGPNSPREYLEWNTRIKKWRMEQQIKRKEISHSSTGYDMPCLKWAQESYVQPNVMLHDLYLFDPVTNKYTVSKLLKDIEERYGTIDSIVIWPSFSNLGCDSRNEEDYFRCLPGGTAGVRSLIDEFHSKNIKVIFPALDWDNGTRDPQEAWSYILPRLFKEYNVDGVRADIAYFTQDFWMNSLAIGHPLVFQSEANNKNNLNQASKMDDTYILQWNTMDISKYETNLRVPTVSTRKLIEPRHMTHSSDKWARNKTNLIQHAFFNGIGIEIWENIFGTWNQLSPRDSEALRRTSSILRCFGPDFFCSPEWEPHCPCIHWKTVFSSKFPSITTANQAVWTFINRGPQPITGHQVTVNYHMGIQFYDVWHGHPLQPTHIADGLATLDFDIEPHGYGCIFATSDISALPEGFSTLMKTMSTLSATRLMSIPISSTILWQELDLVVVSQLDATDNMIRIEGDDDYLFDVKGIEPSECIFEYPAMDIRYPWEHQPSRLHTPYRVKIKPFYIDPYPVTEKEFKAFLDATHYKPHDSTNFLKHWIDGCYPDSCANKPVVHVSVEDARAYAKWAGKRLPHEWEWQYVAQCGTEYRTYPWGNKWDESKVPEVYEGRERLYPNHPPADVNAHSSGRSPFGVYDLVGNIWQWTDVYQDQHTRAAIIRGGSYYKPKNGQYFPQAYRNDEHGKYILMADSIDRSATIGFRCVKDTKESAAALGNCAFFEE
ncbi:hypothetical protein G6F46_002811 [Rhizopus delemar]|uniref:Sulfatase-modifying factor enzyme-like domain-containing protein n=2 Tax=Rhizopus TaxID=4842 RepID=A0A9P6ZB30_9FUNG|nr:hypothetical protein G6F55_000957 [Rhizopus delemar]KAG1549691.1 hypothetical protein G6F51_002908 [Rhizopus arrhizus]KAG1500275.1 hypothetical protein G6F54_003833 [Rhizopus delemar]KAG1516111.1 hypothetical protein G6F53_002412 [Rhizopus delemar]KAG1524705.1 hypothetical protein G6F52_003973 [Rhizopus delemar]